jgi:hypothetical protein
LSKIYEALTGKSLNIKIDTAQGQAALAALDAQYKKLEQAKIKVDVDTAKAESAIKKAEAEAKSGATIDVSTNTQKATKESIDSLKDKNSSIVIEIQGEDQAVKREIESLYTTPKKPRHQKRNLSS